MSQSFIGARWAFPARIDATGGVALVTRERNIEEAIRVILGTAPGERTTRPEFGCRIHDYVFGPVNSDLAGLIVYAVRRALERWEPRIDVDDVVIGFDDRDRGVMYLDIRYTVRGYNDPRNLVFPFYVIPDEVALEPPAFELVSAVGGE